MSKFHSTVTRRDFMKGLGLAGAGLGATAATAPVFHDLDEVTGSRTAGWDRPWYVKDLDFEKATVDIDWDVLKPADQVARMYRLDPTDSTEQRTLYAYRSTIYGWSQKAKDFKTQMIIDANKMWNPDWKGDTLRDMALSGSVGYGRVGELYAGEKEAKTPEDRGLPKWQGTPEENLKLIRTAFRFFGVTDVGVVPLTEKTRKLIFVRNRYRAPGAKGWLYHQFDESPEAYIEQLADRNIGHIPKRCEWMIVWTILQPYEGTKRYGTLSSAAASRAYQQISVIEGQMQDFLRGIGYQGVQGGTGSIGPSNGWGVMGGIGEMTRAYHVITSPEYGNMIRGMNRMVTDLPLEPTHPIDAGIANFCKVCMRCAEACPSRSLSFDRDPTWDPPSQPRAGNSMLDECPDPIKGEFSEWPWNVRGVKWWWLETPTCVMCRNCMGSCPYSKLDLASIHNMVKGIAATTPLFNSFFVNMDGFFGYGLENPDEFWELNMPTYGIDTTRGGRSATKY